MSFSMHLAGDVTFDEAKARAALAEAFAEGVALMETLIDATAVKPHQNVDRRISAGPDSLKAVWDITPPHPHEISARPRFSSDGRLLRHVLHYMTDTGDEVFRKRVFWHPDRPPAASRYAFIPVAVKAALAPQFDRIGMQLEVGLGGARSGL